MNLIEGPVRYRRRKKWKSRWAVLRRVNPAADVIDLILYQDQVSARARQKEKAFISLQSFAGLQLLNKLDKHYNVIVTITANDVIPLSFETIEQRSEWVGHFQKQFGHEQSFQGIIPRHKQKIKSGEATLRFYKTFFTLTRKDTYKFIGKWNLVDLPHYGAVDGGFAFQVKDETTSHGLPSIFYFATRQGRELHQLFDSVCRGVEAPPQNSYEQVEPAGGLTRCESQTDALVSRPNFFKRTWQRISKRGPRRPRPRSRSEPSLARGSNRRKHGEKTASQVSRDLPAVPIEQPKAERKTSEMESRSLKTPSASSTGEHPVTPDGYELMNEDNTDDIFTASKKRINSMSSQSSAGRLSVKTLPEKETVTGEPIEEESTDRDGYVLVDEMDVEEIVKEAERRIAEEKKREEEKQKAEETKEDSPPVKKNDKEEAEAKSGDVSPKKPPLSDEKEPTQADENKGGKPEPGEDTTDGKTMESAKGKLVNGNVCNSLAHDEGEKKDDEQATSTTTNSPRKSVKSLDISAQSVVRDIPRAPRGHKNPPPALVLPDGCESPDSPYVNSPPIRTADYVNVPGRGLNNVRERSRTTPNKPPGAKSHVKLIKKHQYDMYDGNDDSIYHSVESLMPGHPAYQNLQYDATRSHSFENLPGHSYTNVPGQYGGQAYQNIGPPGAQAYVNINTPKRKFQRNPNTHNLNYIRVEGTSGNHGPPVLSSPSDQPGAVKPSSDYTWIDESRTRLLKETARMHSDLRKENLPKVQTKKY